MCVQGFFISSVKKKISIKYSYTFRLIFDEKLQAYLAVLWGSLFSQLVIL